MEKTFGQHMREIRRFKKIKQRTISKKINMSRANLTNIELDKRRPPTREKLDAWIEALGVTDLWEAERIYALAGKYRVLKGKEE